MPYDIYTWGLTQIRFYIGRVKCDLCRDAKTSDTGLVV
jgi:hypothetical protein